MQVSSEGVSWIVFEPSQVKSIFNSGLWDPRSPDLHDPLPEPEPEPAVLDDLPNLA
jgi:hypothetical protein